jgi:hypothetical protein
VSTSTPPDWTRANGNNQPIGVTPESRFTSFRDTYNEIQTKYSGRQIVVTETGWPTTFGPIPTQQFPIGISNARDYLNRVITWALAQQVVNYIHNMFDDQYGVDTNSPFNYYFGLVDYPAILKGFYSNETGDGCANYQCRPGHSGRQNSDKTGEARGYSGTSYC